MGVSIEPSGEHHIEEWDSGMSATSRVDPAGAYFVWKVTSELHKLWCAILGLN